MVNLFSMYDQRLSIIMKVNNSCIRPIKDGKIFPSSRNKTLNVKEFQCENFRVVDRW